MHQIAARSLAEPCLPSMFAYCPTMDLVATVTAKGSVDVWRLNGQRVFGANFSADDDEDEDQRRQEGEKRIVTAVGWRRDGQILAVACADGTVSLINALTGKIALRISPRSPDPVVTSFTSSSSSASQRHSPSRRQSSKPTSTPTPKSTPSGTRTFSVSSTSWTTHFAFPSTSVIRSRLDQSDSAISLDQILGLRADVDRLLELKVDLPRELSAIDVEVSLPKLATLPPHGVGIDDDVFSSRASVDVVFHGGGSTSSGRAAGVDALLIGMGSENGNDTGGCAVHMRIFDSFEIGTVDLCGTLPPHPGQSRVLRVEGHPFLSTEFLLVEQTMTDEAAASLHLLSLDLSFIPQTGQNLPLVAKKATQLANLLRYLSQVQTQLVSEVKAAFDLPTRFLRNINESLAEGDDHADFVYAAHHLAVTGECDPKLKEWLVDEVGDRGLKRWEKAVGDCLDVVRRMTSECLLPALERCLVVLSRLDGLAKFGPTSSRLGLDEKSIQRARETVDALGILGEDLLLDVGMELREFTAFIKWLKWECEVEALEEDSERAEELRESWTCEGELRMVLDYVGGAMKESRLRKYLGTEDKEQDGGLTSSFNEDPDMGFYAEYTKRRAGTSKDKRMPTLEDLVGRLQKQSDVVFGQIAETFRKSILATYMLKLPESCGGKVMDIRVIPDPEDAGLYRLLAVSKDQEQKDAFLQVEVNLRQGPGKSVRFTTSSSTTAIPDIEDILDAKFVDDTAILVLAATKNDARIYEHSLLAQSEQPLWELRHVFEEGNMDVGTKPAMLEVNGHIGRRAVVVLDKVGTGYVVFDLDAGADGGEGQADDDNDDEMMTG